ncbi:MAG: restriction endonuclease subunit S [Alphaproteobacteria bacterium]|nr:restriction endonuclease subunit S [Alphaproteobacteria bacterium]
MLVSELFDIKYGINLELDSLEQSDDADAINFVARTAENNGVVARVKRIPGKEPQPAGILTCAGGGSVLSTFVQDKPFYSGRDLYLLIPKKEMSLEEKLFYCHVIKMNSYRYSYGRQANKTLKNINLPPLPDWLKKYKIDYSPINTKIKHKELPFDTTEWKKFKLSDLFNVVRGVRLTKGNRIPGKMPLATAGASNEGVSDYISNPEMKIYKDAITIDMFCNCFYRSYNFACDDNILVLQEKISLTKFVKLFLVSVIEADKYRYAYGRQYRQKDFMLHKIKLPVDKIGNPDWDYMEEYIKSLPYSDLI